MEEKQSKIVQKLIFCAKLNKKVSLHGPEDNWIIQI